MTWPTDKLQLINRQLALTGNNLCATADDGSDEWTVASAAYEEAVEFMLDQHDWKECTTVATLVSTGIAPTDDQFDTAFAKPPDCVHVIWVRVNYSLGTGGVDVPLLYQILNNQIVVNLGGASTAIVTMKYVSANPPAAIANGQSVAAVNQMLRTFFTALGKFVLSGIYRGLHEDWAAAKSEEGIAMNLLQLARTRSDQEQPKRAMFNSRLSASRRVRRPFPSTPGGWSGSGTPG